MKIVKIISIISLLIFSGCLSIEKKVTANDVLNATEEASTLYEKYNELQSLEDKLIESEEENKEEIVEVNKDQEIINNADYSTLLTKYMTAEAIKNAPEDIIIENNNFRDIWGYCEKDFEKDNCGFFVVVILDNDKVMQGGYGGRGGRNGRFFRNTGLSVKHAEDYKIPVESIKYYFVVRTFHEGIGREVLGRSQLKGV